MPRSTTAAAGTKHLTIPVSLTAEQFERFVLLCLFMPRRGPKCKIGYHKLFNYVLMVTTVLEKSRRRKTCNQQLVRY